MDQATVRMLVSLVTVLGFNAESGLAEEMPWIRVADDQRGFVFASSRTPFVPWGFNYDHDHQGRLLEDYWEAEWPTVEEDFREMERLGANVVRIHLQVGKFLEALDRANPKTLDRLAQLVRLAEQTGLYLNITGLGCYHRKDVPAWYDKLSEDARWKAQACFWEAVAQRCAGSPAVFCYDLMNEPVVPGGRQNEGHWLPGPPLGGKQFVQFITLDPKERPRAKIALAWTRLLVQAIRKHDRHHLITVGFLPGTPDRADAWSGFEPQELVDDLDFLSVHIYPEAGQVDQALKILAQFAVGKPVLIEETFPLKCTIEELETFVSVSRKHTSGWIGFYWGNTPDQLARSGELADAILRTWLLWFARKGEEMRNR